MVRLLYAPKITCGLSCDFMLCKLGVKPGTEHFFYLLARYDFLFKAFVQGFTLVFANIFIIKIGKYLEFCSYIYWTFKLPLVWNACLLSFFLFVLVLFPFKINLYKFFNTLGALVLCHKCCKHFPHNYC